MNGRCVRQASITDCSTSSGCAPRKSTAAPIAWTCTARTRARTARPNSGSHGLDAWRETPYYSARERAALEWTEALTLVSETRIPDDVYERVREQFSEDELVHLSLAIVAINGWNRLNIAARTVPGDYVAGNIAKLHAAR